MRLFSTLLISLFKKINNFLYHAKIFVVSLQSDDIT